MGIIVYEIKERENTVIVHERCREKTTRENCVAMLCIELIYVSLEWEVIVAVASYRSYIL